MRRNRYHGLAGMAALAGLLLFPGAAQSDPAPAASVSRADSLALRIAARYGSEAFPGVRALHYRFNVRFKGKDIARQWTWYPKSDSVLYRGPDEKGLPITAAYSRRNPYSMSSAPVAAIDKSFVNDQYWLLFPMHLKWDKGLELRISPPDEANREKAGPGGKKTGEAHKLTVVYPAAGGYTPGDAYDLFVDSSATLKRWIFRKGNTREGGREAYWSEPVEIGGLHFSLEHPGPDKDFRLWFTDVKVERDPS
jgi:hypothetical protein